MVYVVRQAWHPLTRYVASGIDAILPSDGLVIQDLSGRELLGFVHSIGGSPYDYSLEFYDVITQKILVESSKSIQLHESVFSVFDQIANWELLVAMHEETRGFYIKQDSCSYQKWEDLMYKISIEELNEDNLDQMLDCATDNLKHSRKDCLIWPFKHPRYHYVSELSKHQKKYDAIIASETVTPPSTRIGH